MIIREFNNTNNTVMKDLKSGVTQILLLLRIFVSAPVLT